MLKLGQFALADLDRAYVAVIQLATQPPSVVHQVTLRPDKAHKGLHDLIRLGETQGDEAAGWQHPSTINVVAILGHAVRRPMEEGQAEHWDCMPIQALHEVA